MTRPVPVAIAALAGLFCVAMYFATRTTDDTAVTNSAVTNSAATKPAKAKPYGTLLLDTAALGTPTAPGDGLVVGNERGEILVFSSLAEGVVPKVVSVSKYPITAPVLAKDGKYYAGDENGTFFCCVPDRGVLWSHETGNQITGGALWCDGLVWVGSHDQTLYAFDPESGALRHQVECDGQINGSPRFSSAKRTIYLGSCDGKLRAIDIANGAVGKELDFETPIPGSPALFEDTLYLLGHDGTLAAVGTSPFATRYRVETTRRYLSSPYPTPSYLVATDTEGTVEVYDRRTGKRLAAPTCPEKMTAVNAGNDDALYAVSTVGTLYEWRREGDGWNPRVLHRFDTECRESASAFGDTLVFADTNGGLYYYTTEASFSRASSPVDFVNRGLSSRTARKNQVEPE